MSDKRRPMKTMVPFDGAGRLYEISRGLVLADIRCDTDTMNEIMLELGVPDEAVWTILCILAHARFAAKKIASLDEYSEALQSATVTNLEYQGERLT